MVDHINFKWNTPPWIDFKDNKDELDVFYSLRTGKIFHEKYEDLLAFLKQKLGEPSSMEGNSAKWENKTCSVSLYYNNDMTELTLSKK